MLRSDARAMPVADMALAESHVAWLDGAALGKLACICSRTAAWEDAIGWDGQCAIAGWSTQLTVTCCACQHCCGEEYGGSGGCVGSVSTLAAYAHYLHLDMGDDGQHEQDGPKEPGVESRAARIGLEQTRAAPLDGPVQPLRGDRRGGE